MWGLSLVLHEFSKPKSCTEILTRKWSSMKSEGILEVVTLHPDGGLNYCTRFFLRLFPENHRWEPNSAAWGKVSGSLKLWWFIICTECYFNPFNHLLPRINTLLMNCWRLLAIWWANPLLKHGRSYRRGSCFLLPSCGCLVSFLFSEDAFFSCLPQANEKAVDGGLLPDANGKDPNPGGQTEGSKWQKPRLTRKSLMKCCLVKWIIASTTQQGPGTGT